MNTFRHAKKIFSCCIAGLFLCTFAQAKIPYLIIYVHGTLALDKAASLGDLGNLFSHDISDSAYARRMRVLRQDASLYSTQPTQALGLHPVAITNKPRTASELAAKMYRENNRVFYPNERMVGCYTFGWSGILNDYERYAAAEHFLQELEPLVQQYKKRHPSLKIRIITYSHGSNVVLYMGCANNQREEPVSFKIDDLIMWGTPVQRETDCCSCNPLFKRIYHFYSRNDYVMRTDFFSFSRICSKRLFWDTARCLIPDKVTQVEIKVTILSEHSAKNPRRSKQRINRSPNHCELWHFGAPENPSYRWYSPLYPLPASSLSPAWIKAIEKSRLNATKMILEFHPEWGVAQIRERRCYKNQKEVFCLSPRLLSALKEEAYTFFKKREKTSDAKVESSTGVARIICG